MILSRSSGYAVPHRRAVYHVLVVGMTGLIVLFVFNAPKCLPYEKHGESLKIEIDRIAVL